MLSNEVVLLTMKGKDMKQLMKYPAAIALLAVSFSTFAHGDKHDSKAKYGGLTAEAKDMQYELVAKLDGITIYIEDHGKKTDTKGATAKLILLNGSEKTELSLMPAGDNKLEAKGVFKVINGTKLVSTVTLAGKPAATVRFEMK